MNSIGARGVAKKVVIIGGGITGTGVAREAARRGYDVVLIERGELGSGTSGNFHGILHSGARYAVDDAAVAAECYLENQKLRRIIPSAITNTGGMFVALNQAEAVHMLKLLKACEDAGIPIKELSVEQAQQAEPGLNRELKSAFTVPDGFIDGTEVLRLNREAAVEAEVPASFLTERVVTGFERTEDGAITAVLVHNTHTGTDEQISCDYVVNASGVWAGDVTKLAGLELPMVYDKGTMIIYDRPFSQRVLNRCRPESDGDLLAPCGSRSIMGTTARVIDNPNDCQPTQEEIDVLKSEGSAMVPAMQYANIVFSYSGVRPLLAVAASERSESTRSLSRSFKVVDHIEHGAPNFISIVGGKVTLYRLMAEQVMNLLDNKSSLR